MHVKSSANMKRAELEDGKTSFFLCMCRGWPGSGRGWGPGRCLEGRNPKTNSESSQNPTVVGAVDAGGLGRRDRKCEKGKRFGIFFLHPCRLVRVEILWSQIKMSVDLEPTNLVEFRRSVN